MPIGIEPTKIAQTFARVRGILGLTTLGEGVFVIFGIVPHEPFLLGIALVAAGALLLWGAQLPRVARVRAKSLISVACAAVAVAIVAYDAWRREPLDAPKIVIITLAVATALVVPFDERRIRGVAVASVLLWSVPLAWAPLGVWAFQGALKTVSGGTPLEVFTHYGLLLPLAGVLSILGHSPMVDRSIITFATPRGPMALEVGVACSGIQAMALFVGILGVLVLVERPPTPRAAWWCALGVGGVYAVNVFRLVVLALVGSAWGPNALESVHANAGWIFFVAWSAIFAGIVTRRQERPDVP